jgi:hypothetical protein
MAERRAPEVLIDVENPTAEDVKGLLDAHVAFSSAATPPEFSFAVDPTELHVRAGPKRRPTRSR